VAGAPKSNISGKCSDFRCSSSGEAENLSSTLLLGP